MPMKKLLIALGVLNLLLAGCLVFVYAPWPSGSSGAAGNGNRPEASRERPSNRPLFARFRPAAAPAKVFGWADLASQNLHQFVANLRAVGCPEETIKDLVMAEVARRYGPLEAALKVRPQDVPPWETGTSFGKKAAEGKLRQLLEEKRSLLKDLVGVDLPLAMPSRLAGRDVARFENAYRDLPPDKQDQVRAIQEHYWAQSDDIKARTVGFLEPEDREEFARIKNERRDALAKILSPRELAEFEARTSATAETLRKRFEGFEATPDEFGKILGFMQPLDDEYSLGRRSPDPDNAGFMARRKEAEQAVNDYIRGVLGDERHAEYERTRDPGYRALSAAANELGLPRESVLQAYDTQKLIAAESARLTRDPSLTPEQRMQSIQALQAQAMQSYQGIFGERAAEVLTRLGGGRIPQGMDPVLMQRYGLLPGAVSPGPVNPPVVRPFDTVIEHRP